MQKFRIQNLGSWNLETQDNFNDSFNDFDDLNDLNDLNYNKNRMAMNSYLRPF